LEPLPPVFTTHTFTLVLVREALVPSPAHATAVYEITPAQFTLAVPSAWWALATPLNAGTIVIKPKNTSTADNQWRTRDLKKP
jgi:hypothetical protein